MYDPAESRGAVVLTGESGGGKTFGATATLAFLVFVDAFHDPRRVLPI